MFINKRYSMLKNNLKIKLYLKLHSMLQQSDKATYSFFLQSNDIIPKSQTAFPSHIQNMLFLDRRLNALFQLYLDAFSTLFIRILSLFNIPRKKYALSTAIKLDAIGFLQFESVPITHPQVSSLLQWLLFKHQVTISPIFLQLKVNCKEINSVWILTFMTFIVFPHFTSQNRCSLFQLIQRHTTKNNLLIISQLVIF